MLRQDVLYLVAEDPAAHGVFDEPQKVRRKVFCTVRSVGYQEYYRAMENNLFPTLVFTLTDYAEYKGEKICEYGGKVYRIVRTYQTGGAIELTVEEVTVDA